MNRHLLKHAPLMALSLLASALAQAAEPTPPLPGAGSILQQTQPNRPAPPSSGATGLSIERPDGGTTAAESAPFPVNEIRITGNTRFDAPTLHALVADVEGRSLTLAQLGEAAGRITRYYQDHGYPLARAVIPAQAVHGGVVQLMVIEARYGRVAIDNRSPVDDGLLASTLSPLQGGQTIEQSALDHTLLLLTDIPGVVVSATLKPGDAVGTSDLAIDAAAGRTVAGSVSIDDYGNRYTGRARVGGSVDVVDLLHHGDVLSLDALTSGDRLAYGRVGEDVLLGGAGTHLGASYSALHYKLGGPLSSIGGHGIAAVASAWVKQPFVRSRAANLYGQLQYDHKRLSDDIDATSLHTDRHVDDVTATLTGDWTDAGGTGGATLAITQGSLKFDDAAARTADSTTARTERTFTKLAGSVDRVQSLGAADALYVMLSGQWASANLDASEKMVAGGPYTVRAYDMGVLSGDQGVQGTVEWRHELGQVADGQAQAVAFVDGEHVTLNHTAWAAGTNGASLSGAGLGLNWTSAHRTSLQASVAAPLGSKPALLGTRSSVRAWITVSQAF